MLLLGIDLGTSSIKVSVVDAATRQSVASAQFPETEAPILSPKPGWAEQSPETWWEHVQQAIAKVHATKAYNPSDIKAIGIAYQMHGLVNVDRNQNVLRNSIIWCDSRAVETGDEAFKKIGEEKCLSHLLNSPGNFTASKLAWVKQHQPEIYENTHKIMLPGDYIAMKLTGEITTSISALSEGIFWDFQRDQLSSDVLGEYGFNTSIFPDLKPVFSPHGQLSSAVAAKLNLQSGIPVTYKAGDQPNNALSLNVLEPGEVAATAGTSGVIYGVSDHLTYDKESRVNTFAHVNYTPENKRLGVLLCINGTGILNRWIKDTFSGGKNYPAMNREAFSVSPGCDGLSILPFGNGAERMLGNRIIGAHFKHIDFNTHSQAHVFRAVQEGIVFSLRYGLDIMRENKMNPSVIRAGKANLFLSDLFTEIFVNTTQVPIELHNADGSVGAAIGAGIGIGYYPSAKVAFETSRPLRLVEPGGSVSIYQDLYQKWKEALLREMNS